MRRKWPWEEKARRGPLIAAPRKGRQHPCAPGWPIGSLWLPWPWGDHWCPPPGTVLGSCLPQPAVSLDAGGLREDPASSGKNSVVLTVHVISSRHGWTVQGQFEVELLRWVGCKRCSHILLLDILCNWSIYFLKKGWYLPGLSPWIILHQPDIGKYTCWEFACERGLA